MNCLEGGFTPAPGDRRLPLQVALEGFEVLVLVPPRSTVVAYNMVNF
jgi:hypothetical protein